MAPDLEDFEFAVVARFPNAFPNGRSITLATPRELIAHLVSHASPPREEATLLARAFYRIRSVLAFEVGCAEKRITPRTRLAALMPDPETRRAQWSAVLDELAIPHTPHLARPRILEWAIALVVGAAFLVAVSAAASMFAATWPIFVVGAAVAGAFTLAFLRFTAPWARHFAPRELTVGDLAHSAVAYGTPLLETPYPQMTRSQIIEVVRALVRQEIGASRAGLDVTWTELCEATQGVNGG